jgi:hypothetical protein
MGQELRKGVFSATLGGLVVRCDTEDDAAAIQRAANILHRIDQADYSPQEINRLARTLRRYGHARAARVLAARTHPA